MKGNIEWHQHPVNKSMRSDIKSQRPCLLWFTGLSGSGKSSIAGAVEKKLVDRLQHTYLLDGDNVRHGLCVDLAYTEQDRNENIRRVGEVAKLMQDAGLLVLAAFISPFEQNRKTVRHLFKGGEFIEIFISTPINVCENRDVKGLYAKARNGEISNFTGIDSPYQIPESPEIIIENSIGTVDDAAIQIIKYLDEHGYLKPVQGIDNE